MMLEILGGKAIKADGDVQVDYKTGKTVVYSLETTKHLILNPDEIVSVIINKKIGIK
ncbi:hypothetical protein [Tissierella praeacuta]|uniref:hypothetical protein n=1 Tax=Tissierella praeacuta TaxID=43131 RepID=UPI0028A7B39B|nr:hypothetical protein [Tissierella praeacuta]